LGKKKKEQGDKPFIRKYYRNDSPRERNQIGGRVKKKNQELIAAPGKRKNDLPFSKQAGEERGEKEEAREERHKECREKEKAPQRGG